ncbi:MAG: GlxA family transcriptional regulator [Pseudomonadota bacterium]
MRDQRHSGDADFAVADIEIEPVTLTGPADRSRPQVYGFFLVPKFSLMAMTSALEPLRLANRAAGRELYSYILYSIDGAPVESSAGVAVAADASFRDAEQLDAAVTVSGMVFEHHAEVEKQMVSALRRLASRGATVGAVCTGTKLLAKAGLVDGHRVTIHWEYHPSLVADHPDLDVTQELFEIDRNRFTCAGGTAAADLMLTIVGRDHGRELVSVITDQLVHHRVRESGERQRMDLRSRLGVAHPKLLQVVARMEETIETPLSCAELASHAGVSTRQLERLFAKYLGHSPTRHYLIVRLSHARFLLQQTSMPILSVAMACGFVSASHFSKSYSEHFGHTPSTERRRKGGLPTYPGAGAPKPGERITSNVPVAASPPDV